MNLLFDCDKCLPLTYCITKGIYTKTLQLTIIISCMAEQKAESTTRTFDSVIFPQFNEGYKVKIEFDAEAETITLLFINTADTNS